MDRNFIAEIIQPLVDEIPSISDWGVVDNHIPVSYERFERWVADNKHGPLNYLADGRKEKRKSLTEIFPQAKSILMFSFSYLLEKAKLNKFYESDESNGLKVSSYALGFEGQDYHHFVKNYLKQIGDELTNRINGLEYSLTLDTAPVLERDFALQAGLGWFGKNSMLISKKYGSFQILGGLILNIEIETEQTIEADHCGQCTKCIQACPTLAIDPFSRTIDSAKCISTYTIELFKEADPPDGYENSNGEIFGCDICQEVCPWNHRPLRNTPIEGSFDFNKSKQTHNIKKFLLTPKLTELSSWLEGISNREFKRIFKSTPLERTGRVGLLKNLRAFK